LLIVAVAVEEEVHVAVVVTFCVVPSLMDAVAVNWPVIETGMDGLDGTTVIDLTLGNTVRTAVPETPLIIPVMVAFPAVTPVAAPEEEIVATDVLEEFHVVDDVRSICEPSE
jgi:hypothetical protein